MISRNSFWGSMKENNKRRLWVWVISALTFFFYYPVGVALALSNTRSRQLLTMEHMELTPQEIRQGLLATVGGWIGSGSILMVIATALAVFCGIHGFSYLYSRRKIDLYHSLPVSKARRFFSIWVNGVLVYAVPCLLGMICGLAVAAQQGAVSAEVVQAVVIIFLYALVFYFCFYNLTVLAVMLTGHLVITILGILVLSLYEFFARIVIGAYQESFFDKYVYSSATYAPWLSPFRIYAQVFELKNVSDWPVLLMPMLQLLLFGAVLLAIAYLCYWKRPAEAAGKALVFAVIRPVIKIGIVVPGAMYVALIINQVSNGSVAFIAFAIIACVVLGCCMIEVIYEFDIRACFHHKKYMLITGILTVGIILGFHWDLMGFDAYVPKEEDIESYAIVLPGNYSYQYFDKNADYISADYYIWDNMYIQDAGAIHELAAAQPQLMEEGIATATVTYRLKNGRTVYRYVWLDYQNEETQEMLNRIVRNKEYKKGFFMIMADYFTDWLTGNGEKKVILTYGVGEHSFVSKAGNTIIDSPEIIDKIIELYRKDLENIGYADIYKNLPVGILQFTFENYNERGAYYNNRYSEVELYANCVQTIAYLKEMGLYLDPAVRAEDIERIDVTNFNYENEEYNRYYNGVTESREVTVSYHDRETIAQIAGGLFPSELYRAYDIQREKLIDSKYLVTVYFKYDTVDTKRAGSVANYRIWAGQVPDFVEKETSFQSNAGGEIEGN